MSNSLAAMRPELVREWSEKNLPLAPDKINLWLKHNRFLDYLKNTPKEQNWYPIFAVMVDTGLRVDEATGL